MRYRKTPPSRSARLLRLGCTCRPGQDPCKACTAWFSIARRLGALANGVGA